MRATLLSAAVAARLPSERVVIEAAPEELRPVVYYYPALTTWRLMQPFTFDHRGTKLHIPAPFDLDLASTPRVLWPLMACHELGILAPLVHDWLHRTGGDPSRFGYAEPHRTYTRSEADSLFRYHMQSEGVGKMRRNAAYAAVRAFGGSSWRTQP
jgi:hypothetical protein